MPVEIVLQQSTDVVALLELRGQLAAARAALAEREAELAQVKAEMKVFEGRYLRQVGVLYAELDELEARIAEREVDLYDSDSARRRAQEARLRAKETHDSAFGEASEAEELEPPPNLKSLFREVARRIHPDFARDEAEQAHFTLLMARANQAYGRGDTETLERMLDDHLEIHEVSAREGAAAEVLRVARQLKHAERDIAALEAERQMLHASELGQLQLEAAGAASVGRDLLHELANSLREQLTDARHRFERVDRQISAHGR